MDFDGADLGSADFERADMRAIRLTTVNLLAVGPDATSFRGANLSEARLARACLQSVDFTGAVLKNCVVDESDCRGAVFVGADLSGVDVGRMMIGNSDNSPILITGGCGFIGCNLADRLAEGGRRVLILDNLARAGVRENAQWLKSRHGDCVNIVVGDVRDPMTVIELVRKAGAVLHLAAQVAVTNSLENPLDDFEINARGTLNVLEAVRLHNPSAAVLFASTNKVYGRLIDDRTIRRGGLR